MQIFSVGTVAKPLPEACPEDPKSGSESDPECYHSQQHIEKQIDKNQR